MARFVGVRLLSAASVLGGCAAPRSGEPSRPDASAGVTPQRGEQAQPAGSVRAAPQDVERTLPEGAVRIELRFADARDVARTLNELDEASFWAARARGCVLDKPPLEVLGDPAAIHDAEAADAERASMFGDGRWIPIEPPPPSEERELEKLREFLRGGSRSGPLFHRAPPPPSFRAWDARTLVVLEAGRDDAFLPHVRELVDRLDRPARPESDR